MSNDGMEFVDDSIRETQGGRNDVYTVSVSAEEGHIAYVNSSGRTYADFVTAWNLQRGDLVTFVTVQKRE